MLASQRKWYRSAGRSLASSLLSRAVGIWDRPGRSMSLAPARAQVRDGASGADAEPIAGPSENAATFKVLKFHFLARSGLLDKKSFQWDTCARLMKLMELSPMFITLLRILHWCMRTGT